MITVNTKPLEWHEGMTIEDILKAKDYTFSRIMVWLNEKPITDKSHYATTVVPDGSVVQVIHIFAGG